MRGWKWFDTIKIVEAGTICGMNAHPLTHHVYTLDHVQLVSNVLSPVNPYLAYH